jgi:hypothetical protein
MATPLTGIRIPCHLAGIIIEVLQLPATRN